MKEKTQSLKTLLRTPKGMIAMGLVALTVVAVIVFALTAQTDTPDIVNPAEIPSVTPIVTPEIDVSSTPDVTDEPITDTDVSVDPTPKPTSNPIVDTTPTPTTTAKPTHQHSYEVSNTVSATCTTAGYKVMKCSCGSTYQEDTDAATGHTYKNEVIAPTTSAQGYTKHTCTVCGHSFKDSYTDCIVETTPTPEVTPAPETTPSTPSASQPYCRTCGQYGHEMGDSSCPGMSNTCNRFGRDKSSNHYLSAGDSVCPICGANIPAWTCHSH